jgi:hypothetical protein
VARGIKGQRGVCGDADDDKLAGTPTTRPADGRKYTPFLFWAWCAPQKVQSGITRQFSVTNIHDAIRRVRPLLLFDSPASQFSRQTVEAIIELNNLV